MKNESSTEEANTEITETKDTSQAPDVSANIESSTATATDPPKISHKRLIGLVGLFIAIIGVAMVFAASQDKPANKTNTNATTASPVIDQFAVIYAKQSDATTNVKDCQATKTQLYRQSTAKSNGVMSKLDADLGSVSFSDVYHNQSFVVLDEGCASNSGVSIWYSSDQGNNYSRIYRVNMPEGTVQDQITSAHFSDDGKTILIAYLNGSSNKNTIKEITPATKAVKDLAKTDRYGVFLSAYQRDKKLYYYAGCYNCDGNTYNQFYVYDIATGVESTVYLDEKLYGGAAIANTDFTKFLLAKSTPAKDALGGDAPYYIQWFDPSAQTTTNIATISKGIVWAVGYTDDVNQPIYSLDDKLYSIDKDNKVTELYKADKTIIAVHYVDKDRIIYSQGEFGSSTVMSYDTTTKKSTKLLDVDSKMTVIGVNHQ